MISHLKLLVVPCNAADMMQRSDIISIFMKVKHWMEEESCVE